MMDGLYGNGIKLIHLLCIAKYIKLRGQGIESVLTVCQLWVHREYVYVIIKPLRIISLSIRIKKKIFIYPSFASDLL